jgi:hypothetical protein
MAITIDELYAFVAVDDDGNEGIAAFLKDGVWYPMVGADMERIDDLRPRAKKVAELGGVLIKLCKFSARDEVEVIGVVQ